MKNAKNFLKHYLWAQKRNRYQPPVLRLPVLLFVMLALLGVQLAGAPAARQGEVLGAGSSIKASQLLTLTNEQRVRAGLDPLRPSAKLQAAAQAKAADMFQHNYWAHYAPDGTTPWSFIENGGYSYRMAGENLAKNFPTSRGVMAGWMSSPAHRENLLSKAYRDVGIATAEGEINGQPTSVVVALYAAPQLFGAALLDTKQEHAAGVVLPAQARYSLPHLLSPATGLSLLAWGFVVVCVLFAGLYLAQHIVMKRHGWRWERRAHSHPMLQSALFGGLAVLLVQTGFGVAG